MTTARSAGSAASSSAATRARMCTTSHASSSTRCRMASGSAQTASTRHLGTTRAGRSGQVHGRALSNRLLCRYGMAARPMFIHTEGREARRPPQLRHRMSRSSWMYRVTAALLLRLQSPSRPNRHAAAAEAPRAAAPRRHTPRQCRRRPNRCYSRGRRRVLRARSSFRCQQAAYPDGAALRRLPRSRARIQGPHRRNLRTPPRLHGRLRPLHSGLPSRYSKRRL